MATINDLLYNYQDTNEFVCSDGRMSVNGICQAAQQPDSVDASNITKEIIETSKDGKDKDVIDKFDTGWNPSMGPRKDMGYTENKKEKFEWNFDKETKIDGYKSTISNNINAYDSWIESNLGIPKGAQTALRVGGSGVALAAGSGLVAAVAPWLLPIFAGGAINKAERERIEKITDQDKQGDIHTIDMMTYDTPKPGDEGFNIHQDKGDQPHGTDTSGDFAGKGSNNPFGI